jgi:PPK2 family polyphosphate:nucleotide phosphotransferase
MAYAHRIDGSSRIRLKDYDPDDTGKVKREEGEKRTAELGAEWMELSDLMFCAGRHALLIVLQGRDTSGKDGTIRCILNYSDAQSCTVAPFKIPTPEEAAHDFLWRVHKRAPGRGAITIYNRSHYEDVLVVRVHNVVPEDVWRRRYAHINHYEALLHDSSTLIVKLYLHISKNEQEERLLDREKETEKAWKLSVGDWKERELWDDYTAAYEDALNECASPKAPWHVVPANHKWYRNLAVMEQLVEALRPHRKEWLASLEATGAKAKKELEAYRAQQKQK